MIPPKIDDAPGLVWRPCKAGWLARWQCRTDLAVGKNGFKPRTVRLWSGAEPDADDIAYIQSQCTNFQNQMLVQKRGGVPKIMTFNGTWRGLIAAYQRDKDSPYRKLRYATRVHYDVLCDVIDKHMGRKTVLKFTARDALAFHAIFTDAGHVPMGHSVIGMTRTILTFGATILGDKTCREIRDILRDMRFEVGKSRSSTLSAEQATLIRAEAHRVGRHSIALAQAFQFDCMFRQKDVIGEKVPISEQGLSATIIGNAKWMRGIRWDEINASLVLTHVTSKRQKELTIDLRLAPMVLAEFDIAFPGWGGDRAKLPANGPIVVNELQLAPWSANEFRRQWRLLATAVGVPKGVRNMDSRAGAITEATEAGANLESIKHAATHSDIAMTQRYARGAEEKTADVMRLRAKHRENKS